MLRGVILLIAVAPLVALSTNEVHASHPFVGGPQVGGFNYLYRDLETGGDGRITYRLCGTAQNPVPPQWGQGVENWDIAMASEMTFDAVISCTATANTELRWHSGNECAGGHVPGNEQARRSRPGLLPQTVLGRQSVVALDRLSGGCLDTGPRAEAMAVHFLDVFVRDCNGALYTNHWNTAVWSGWLFVASWP